jgi:hypothetical protein
MSAEAGKKLGACPVLASRITNLYNPTSKPQQPFVEDYPNGAETNAAGRLARTIDGDDIGARFVVGRRMAEGADEALPPAAFDAIAEAIVGAPAKNVAQSALGRDVGRTLFNRHSRRPEGVLLSEKLTAEQLPKVYAHEIGHVVGRTFFNRHSRRHLTESKSAGRLQDSRNRAKMTGYIPAPVPRMMHPGFRPPSPV